MDMSCVSSSSCLCPEEVDGCRQLGLIVGEESGDNEGPSEFLLPRSIILAYGTGHMLNDLAAACWFTYLLIFLTDIGLSPKQAGVVMLIGQVADGIGTVSVGQLIDKFGRFKLWHAAGSLLVAASFSSVFGGCWTCDLLGAKSTKALALSYSIFAAVFNLGWAATQVSHMSLVNCVTANATSRVALNSCRNAFTMLANLCLYVIAFAVFEALPSSTVNGVQRQFQWIVGLATIIGCLFILIFHLGVGEPRLLHHQESSVWKRQVPVLSWFRKPLYYQVALVYMLTRLTTNVSQSLLSFYIMDDLRLGQSAKALVPALIYLCSLACSLFMQELNWTNRKLKAYFISGAALWMFSGAVLLFIPPGYNSIIYLVSITVGAANALMLVTATSMEGVLIGKNLSGCAFIYGSLSFLEKLTCGLTLYIIEGFHGSSRGCTALQQSFLCHASVVRLTLAILPGACAFVASLVTLLVDLDKAKVGVHEPMLAAGSNISAAEHETDSVGIAMPLNDGPAFGTQPISVVGNIFGVRGRAGTTAGGSAIVDDKSEDSNTLGFGATWTKFRRIMVPTIMVPYYTIIQHEHKP